MAAPTPQTTLKSRATEAARNILEEQLSLRGGETVAFFHDEQGVTCANCFADAARYLRIRVLPRYVPSEKQHGGALGREDLTILEQADAVLTCFAESLKSTAYRRQLVDQAALDQRVLGTLSPSLHSLAQAAGRRDDDWQECCDDLAQIFLRGKEAELITAVRNSRGDVIEEHRLTVSLGGFKRAPVTSGGTIHTGTWSRLPSPEVTIAPIEDTANGVFVLNGAFPGGAMSGSEHLLLVFAAGRLEMVGGNSSRVGEFWKIVESGKNTSGGQALGLSEIGIRLWDLATEDSPERLLHFGLGDNTALGGALRSPVQEAMLGRQASLRVDGLPVLAEGHFCYEASAWRESADVVRRLSTSIGTDCEIRLTRHLGQADTAGRLRVTRQVGRKRVCSYRPGDAFVGERLCELYLALQEQRSPLSLPALARQLVPGSICGSLMELRGLLAILRQHRLIEVREPMNLEWNGEAA
jgi:hypothetical protein